MRRSTNGNKYVTFKWLLTTIISSGAAILLIVGGLANATFYSKPAGAAVEAKVDGLESQLTELKMITKETQNDIKILIARKR